MRASPLHSSSVSLGHIPVLCEAVVRLLDPAARPGTYLDGTFGAGQHTRALLASHPGVIVHGIDRDPAARGRAEELANDFPGRFHFHDANFADLEDLELPPLTGALFDLGVSSFHFDEGERGFSFRFDGPVDMRMDPRAGRSALELLERGSEPELVHAVRDLGEEPRWRKVVHAIREARGTGQLTRTISLAEVVETAARTPRHRRPGIAHPATRTFQGLRLAVNGELDALRAVLPAAFDKLVPAGRLAVISFHSLEDRLVKRAFRHFAGMPESARDHRPQQERLQQATLLTRRPVTADEAECIANPRARSAKLRVLEKLAR